MRYFIAIIFIMFLFHTGLSQRIQRCDNGMYGLAVTKSNGNIKWLAKPKYTSIETSKYGTFLVCAKSGFWGVISSAGKEIIPCRHISKKEAAEAFESYTNPKITYNQAGEPEIIQYPDFTLTRDYSNYIKKYVEDKINSWQKKGEFEKTADYHKRVTETSRKAMVLQLTNEACDICLSRAMDKNLKMALGEYDADNETFLIETAIGRIVLPVKIDDAPYFKNNWPDITSQNSYDIANGKIILRSATFFLKNKTLATYSDQNNALYAQANIQYNFDPLEIPLPSQSSSNKTIIEQKNIYVGKSDVDINIPSTFDKNEQTFALIIANENYRDEANVEFAINDGRTIEKYFTNTLGIPQQNIHRVDDATKNDMIREVDWLRNVSSVYGKNINILIYYAGHGVPNETDGTAYLIPIDGLGHNPKTLYPLAELYDDLAKIQSKSTTVFLDACFSGALRGSGMLASARGVALKAKKETPKANVVVSAATGDETAWPYSEKGHGLFTYFILKKLQSSKGNVTLGQLTEYVIDQVGKHSIVSNSKKQTPTVSASPNISSEWENIKLK